jgi:hypothetical protein
MVIAAVTGEEEIFDRATSEDRIPEEPVHTDNSLNEENGDP